MIARLVRIAASLAVVVMAYGAYALAVVPLVEPRAEVQVASKAHEPSRVESRDPKARLRRQYGRYFPADSWELQDAKVLESDQAIFFIRDYHNLPDGRVVLRPFTMLFMPRDQRPDGAGASNSKVIALESPEGAILEFDEPFDMRRAKIGKLVGGNLTGPIHIHNAPPQPGSADELDIVTRDVELIEDRIVTPNKVDFRFGPNVGSGRDLKILLTQREGDDGKKGGANFSGIRSLELLRDVKVRVLLGGKGLMPGAPQAKPAADPAPAKPIVGVPAKPVAGQPAKADPPVQVTCQGPFLFDVAKSVATFSDRVDVLRLNPVGECDTMNCDMLAIHFAPRQDLAAKPVTPPPPGAGLKPVAPPQPPPRSQPDPTDKDALSNLEARMIEARGEPVIVRSPSNGGNVRCQRLEYDVRNGTIRLDGSKEVLLNQGANEIRTRKLDYQPATTGRLGRLTAVGPGTLHGVMPEDPTRKYQARWSKQLLMLPEGPLHKISLLGNAMMQLSDTGTLTAEDIYIWVSEPPPPDAVPQPSAPPRPAAQNRLAGPSKPAAQARDPKNPAPIGQTMSPGGVQVERLLAQEKVRIDSPQLTGATHRLEVWFDRPPAAGGPVVAVPAGATIAGAGTARVAPIIPAQPASFGPGSIRPPAAPLAAQGSPAVAQAPVATPGVIPLAASPATPPAAPAQVPGQSAAPQLGAPQRATRPANPLQRFDVAGSLLRLQVAAQGTALAVSDVVVDGNARLVETKTAKPGDKPLLVRGQNLHMTQADTPNSKVVVTGKPAYVEARGMTLSGAAIQMEKASNRLWVDGAGRMTLPAKGQLGPRQADARRDDALKPGAHAVAKQPTDRDEQLELTWQGAMNFDGLIASYDRSVLAKTERQWLRTEHLDVTLKRRIDFGAGMAAESGAAPSEVDTVKCRGGVLLESRTFDQRGLSALDLMQLDTISVNQTTGAVDGQGPGWVNSVRRGDPPAAPGAAAGGAKKPGEQKSPAAVPTPNAAANIAAAVPAAANGKVPAGAATPKEDRLNYLHVQFERGITGNMNRRELTFTDEVRTVYGPVRDWQDKLDGDNLTSLGTEGIVMKCDSLTVREMPPAIRTDKGTMELEAIGNTLVEGQTFTARSHRLTYAQAKDLLVLEGDGRGDAELYRQVLPGLPTTKASARKIMYWRTANRAEVDDARYIDLGNLPGAQPTKPVSKGAAGFITPIPGMKRQ